MTPTVTSIPADATVSAQSVPQGVQTGDSVLAAVAPRTVGTFQLVGATWKSMTGTVTIQVRTLGGKLVKTVCLSRRSVNAWHTLYMRCDLRKGTYKFQVMAIDSGGNHQRKKAVNTLLVR